VFAFYKKMIALRKELDVLKDGTFNSLCENGKIYAFERRLGDRRTVSVMNMTGKPVKLPDIQLPQTLLACNYREPAEQTLQPFEFRLLTDEEVTES
jgi:glycosidase